MVVQDDLGVRTGFGRPDGDLSGGAELARRLAGLVENLESPVALAAMRLGQRTPTLSIS